MAKTHEPTLTIPDHIQAARARLAERYPDKVALLDAALGSAEHVASGAAVSVLRLESPQTHTAEQIAQMTAQEKSRANETHQGTTVVGHDMPPASRDMLDSFYDAVDAGPMYMVIGEDGSSTTTRTAMVGGHAVNIIERRALGEDGLNRFSALIEAPQEAAQPQLHHAAGAIALGQHIR